MSYCPNCGQQVDGTMRFCPNCGAALSGTAVTPVYNNAAGASYSGTVNQTANDYRLVLVSPGTCKTGTVRDVLSDVLGYTAAEAKTLAAQTPIEIAHTLTFQQALDLARMFTEYGMQIAVYNSGGYVDLSGYATTSVFNNDGTVLTTVAVTLASLSIANRVRDFLRWTRPDPFRFLFAPRYRYAPPPPRPIIRRPPPPGPMRGPGGFGGPGPMGGGPMRGPGGGPMGGRGPGGGPMRGPGGGPMGGRGPGGGPGGRR